jgi:hypothetical protein
MSEQYIARRHKRVKPKSAHANHDVVGSVS